MFRVEKRPVAIAGGLLAIFAVSFFVLWKPDASPPTANAPAPRDQRDSFSAPPPARPLAAPPPTADVQPSPAVTRAVAPVAAEVMPAAAQAPGELPVTLHFRSRPGGDGYLEGSILNSSGEDLMVELDFYSQSRQRGSKLELTIPAYHASTFGRDDGLEIRGGDELTIKSSAYAEMRVPIG